MLTLVKYNTKHCLSSSIYPSFSLSVSDPHSKDHSKQAIVSWNSTGNPLLSLSLLIDISLEWGGVERGLMNDNEENKT